MELMKVTGGVLGQYFAWSKVKKRMRQRNINLGRSETQKRIQRRQPMKQTSGLTYNATWVFPTAIISFSLKNFLSRKMQ